MAMLVHDGSAMALRLATVPGPVHCRSPGAGRVLAWPVHPPCSATGAGSAAARQRRVEETAGAELFSPEGRDKGRARQHAASALVRQLIGRPLGAVSLHSWLAAP